MGGVLEWIFGVIFAIELTGKLCALQLGFFTMWNLFDAVVVASWTVGQLSAANLHVNPMILRVMRAFRLVRLLRLVRWVKAFTPLSFIIKSIVSSFAVLMWSLCILSLVIGFIGMLVCSYLQNYLLDPLKDESARHTVFERFGTFTRAGVAMLEVTLANWAPPCWLLTNNVSEVWALFFVVYKCSIGFAVVQVILSVFIQQTFKIASLDEEVMIHDKKMQSRAYVKNLEHLFTVLDKSKDGIVTHDEFLVAMRDPVVQTWFAAIGIDALGQLELFDLL